MAEVWLVLLAGSALVHVVHRARIRRLRPRRVSARQVAALRELYERDRASYYRTAHWQRLRRLVKERDGWVCRTCWRADLTGSFPVHHRTYDRIGCERLEDLTNLCDDCHRAVHEVVWKARRRNRISPTSIALSLSKERGYREREDEGGSGEAGRGHPTR